MRKNVVEISGLNIDRAVRLLHKQGIRLTGVQRHSARTVRLCAHCGSKKLVALFKNSCYNLKIIKSSEPMVLARSLLLRAGLFAGALLFFAAAALYSSGVRMISVTGAEKLDESVVIEQLYDLGVRPGVSKSSIDIRGLESQLTSRLPGAALVSVRLTGVKLTVRIVERTDTGVIAGEGGDLVSAFEGVVTGLIVFSGTAKVQPGDKVSMGQVLIEAKLFSPDGSYTETKADGEVYGERELVYSQTFEEEVTRAYRTGESRSRTYYRLFGSTYPADTSFSAGYSVYEEEVNVRYAFSGMLLPVERVTVTYHEIAYMTERADFEKVKKYIIEEAESAARAVAEESGEVTGLVTEVNDVPGGKLISVRVSVRGAFAVRLKSEDVQS